MHRPRQNVLCFWVELHISSRKLCPVAVLIVQVLLLCWDSKLWLGLTQGTTDMVQTVLWLPAGMRVSCRNHDLMVRIDALISVASGGTKNEAHRRYCMSRCF